MRNAASLDDAGRKLQARLSALSKAHDELMQSDWVGASVHDIVQMTAGNVGMEEGIASSCPAQPLPWRLCRSAW